MPRTNRITTDDGDCAVLASSLHRRIQTMSEAIMDSARFDAHARACSDGTTRRTLARLLGGLALGLLLSPIPGAAKKDGDAKQHGRGTPRGKGAATDTEKATGKPKQGTKDAHHPRDSRRNKDRPKAHPSEPTDAPIDDPTHDPPDELTPDPIADAPRPPTRGAQRQDVTTAADGDCRQAGKPCTRGKQCCTGKCLGSGVCSCNASNPCPRPTNPCKEAVCSDTGRCVNQNRADGAPCDTTGGVCASGQCVAACQAEDKQTTCTGTQCGTVPNNCDQLVDCGSCASEMACQSGACVCPLGKTACGNGHCANTQIDPTNCGRCGTICDEGNGTCQNGICATPEVCDGVDNNFDGAVDECPGNQVCRSGLCGCPAGTRDCDGDDRCEQLGTNEHCAECTPCTGGKVCQGGALAGTCGCPDGTRDCGATCAACCGNADCPSSQVCQDGRCATCNGISCGNGCGCLAGSVCEDGGCVPCPAGTKECARDIGGTVVVSCTPLDDCCPSRGNDCPADQVCQEDGQCGCNGTRCGDNCTCASDQVCWDGWCNDPSCFDDAECPHNQFCQNGACVCPGELCGYDDCCVGGMICQDGQCVHTSCINTADCSPNQYCYNGQCRCNTPCGTRCCVPCSGACN
jgi:hypothetical protein